MDTISKFAMITLVLCGMIPVGCGDCGDQVPPGLSRVGLQSDASSVTDAESLIKDRQFHAGFGLPTRPMNIVRKIEPKDNTFIYPVSLAVSKAEGAYISDNNAHVIVHSLLNSDLLRALLSQGGNGRLLWPNSIEAWQHQVATAVNDGIKIFGPGGSFKKQLRIYGLAESSG